ncbi:6781_t:CDS:2 [Diversispora eburnea]|uniref:6781_t:CDS:1 n=1 Tax=Diversispora eburnea TaxID=1213867 RepID=A0A9N9BGQ7_9GLOM|nr:6781_t:CDS:2 [Diversispora eburnea]
MVVKLSFHHQVVAQAYSNKPNSGALVGFEYIEDIADFAYAFDKVKESQK